MPFKKLIKSNLAAVATTGAAAYTLDNMFRMFDKKRTADYEEKWQVEGYKKVQIGTTEIIDFVGTCMQPYPRKVPVYAWQKPDSKEQPYDTARRSSPT